MDPETLKAAQDVATTGLAAWASKDLVAKLLGPTVDYLGAEIAAFTRKCNINLSDIFVRAARKVGERLDEPLQVPPRVLKGILEDAPYSDDALSAEYFAGVLASSRTDSTRDDRGVSLLALIRELSTYQLRLHYLCYYLVKELHGRRGHNLQSDPDTRECLVFMPFEVYEQAMLFDDAEQRHVILNHSVNGLRRANLIGQHYAFGDFERIKPPIKGTPRSGIVLQPTSAGTELYLWAQGQPNHAVASFLEAELETEPLAGVVVAAGAQRARVVDGCIEVVESSPA